MSYGKSHYGSKKNSMPKTKKTVASRTQKKKKKMVAKKTMPKKRTRKA